MKKYIAIIVLIAASLTINAQSLWNVTYDMSLPFGDTKSFVEKTSFRGFGVDGRQFVADDITLGGSWSWNVFYSSEQDVTTETGNITVTGNHYNYGNYMPLMFTAHKYFGVDGGIRPFVGTGVGTIWKEEKKDIGSFNAFTDNAWQFGFTPEVGVFIPVSNGAIIFLNAKYTYGIQTGQLTPTSYLNFGIGFGWENF